jgi:hypothetical protein
MKSLLTSVLSGLLLLSSAAPALAVGHSDPSCDGDKKGEEEKKKDKNPALS